MSTIAPTVAECAEINSHGRHDCQRLLTSNGDATFDPLRQARGQPAGWTKVAQALLNEKELSLVECVSRWTISLTVSDSTGEFQSIVIAKRQGVSSCMSSPSP
jgi:hypothetical protein